MWRQYQLFRTFGGGRFRPLVEKVSRDVAMIRWLDGNANRKGQPNENYGRELQELFTLGIGHYTETDIREIARAFTGWGSRHHTFVFTDAFHDHGEKTVHGKKGEDVSVNVPLHLAMSALPDSDGKLSTLAMAGSLGAVRFTDLVEVHDGNDHVRIWVW